MGVSPTLSCNRGSTSTTRPETDGAGDASTSSIPSASPAAAAPLHAFGGLPTSTPSTSLDGCLAAWRRILSRAAESTSNEDEDEEEGEEGEEVMVLFSFEFWFFSSSPERSHFLIGLCKKTEQRLAGKRWRLSFLVAVSALQLEQDKVLVREQQEKDRSLLLTIGGHNEQLFGAIVSKPLRFLSSSSPTLPRPLPRPLPWPQLLPRLPSSPA